MFQITSVISKLVLDAAVGWNGCGASLIHEDIVLSAAHCNAVVNNTVYVGAYRRFSDREGAELRFIVARRIHPHYDIFTDENDFLVMKLDQAVRHLPPSSVQNPYSK
jgi:hypothetical protein